MHSIWYGTSRQAKPVCSGLTLIQTALSVSSTKYTQSGNDHFMAHIPSWWKYQPSLVRLGAQCTPTPFHSIYHHVQSCGVRSSWEGRYTPPIYILHMYSAASSNLNLNAHSSQRRTSKNYSRYSALSGCGRDMRCGFLHFGCLWILPPPATIRTYMENTKVCSEIVYHQKNCFRSLELVFAVFF